VYVVALPFGTQNCTLNVIAQHLIIVALRCVAWMVDIGGVPGTGKTSTVKQVVTQLQATSDIPKFDFLLINARELSRPANVYAELYRQITKTRASVDKALAQLPSLITSTQRDTHWLVLLDELDFLRSRKQEVLYNMFEWPNRAQSRMIVIGIANTIDLIQRYLPPKIESRIGMTDNRRATWYCAIDLTLVEWLCIACCPSISLPAAL
jgi:Cdc6-like AAA superfamily ATPase